MQTANIMLALGGDTGTQVPKYGVTASEIALLRLIHGEAAVTDVEPAGDVDRSDRDEIRRLAEIYGNASVTDNFGTPTPAVQVLFPGAAARAFRSIDELDLPDEFFKPKTRVSAREAAPAKAESDESVDDMTKAELVAYAKSKDIEIDADDKKADILAAIKKAEDQDDGDEVTDMPDGKLFG